MQSLVLPIAVILALTFAFGTIRRSVPSRPAQSVIFGFLFGGSAIIAMAEPINLGYGVIVDLRTLMVALAVAFSGPFAGVIALVMAVAFRLYLGGAGAMAGSLALIMCYPLALIWRSVLKPRIGTPVLSDVALGGVISLALLTGFMLPAGVQMAFFFGVGPFVVLSNTLGAVVLGHLFRREMRFQENEQTLDRIASMDPLTETFNRWGTERKLKELKVRHPEDMSQGQAMMYVDVDEFKAVNDTFGHATGDRALQIVAHRIRGSVRSDAIISRLGGDEFMVFLPVVDRASIRTIAERLCEAVRMNPMEMDGRKIRLSVSLGAFWANWPMDLEEMRDRADDCLLKSKQAGRDRPTVGYSDEADLVRIAKVAA